LGSTVGNFDKNKINEIIKSVKEEVIVHMGIVEVNSKEYEEGVIEGYENKIFEKFVLGPMVFCGFKEEDFVLDESTGLRYKVRFENGMVKESVCLAHDIDFEGCMLSQGATYDIVESRKFSLSMFKEFIAPSCGDNVVMLSESGAMAVCRAQEQANAVEQT
jgi:hypothetical protein